MALPIRLPHIDAKSWWSFSTCGRLTAFAEVSEPEEVMRVLHDYHAAMGKLILEHGGTLERFTGDGIMIFLNDPVVVPNPAERALRMALAMRDRVANLRFPG